jgi:hypothetical protein
MRARLVGRLLAAGMLALDPIESGAQTLPKSGAKPGGFRLFARANVILAVNRVFCSINASGEICHDPNTGVGGFWPRGTSNNYVFNSGFQIAGIVGGDESFRWLGDTTGASFFAATGIVHGVPVRLIHNSGDQDDRATWPDAARVPDEETEANPFYPLLRGRVNAGQSDVWWVTWEGDPGRNEGRPHPLGVLLEQRGMGWNFPAGNEDIIYFVFTVYNITSTDPTDYAGVRPAMREILLERAAEFRKLNEEESGVALPQRGYPIEDAYVAFAADMDVGFVNLNYASVNVPFALGYTYDHRFGQEHDPRWTFDPDIFGPPFFPGAGFVGVKYLSSPRDSLGREMGLVNFSGYEGGSGRVFDEPVTTVQHYRYLSARLDPRAGDPQCNTGNPTVTHICFINQGFPSDMRFFQSTGPLTIQPGGSASVVVAYIFAAPVQVGSCTPPCDVRPGDPTILGDAARMAGGVNVVDSITGYAGFEDANADGRVEQREFQVVPGSLLGKALVAQAVFDNGFLVPFAPDAPPFYLVPGDDQVTVLWQPSLSEASGDPFFESVNTPTTIPPGGGLPVPNPLYDPNYRQYDVEGYRIYRGRVDSPSSLQLLAQFDYAGTVISDYQGQVNPVPTCAPEIGIDAGPDPETGLDLCDFDPIVPGEARVKHVDVPLVGPLVQVRLGRRAALADGRALLLEADTAVIGAEGGCGRSGNASECVLRDTGVPFVYVDRTPRNNLRYFYSVSAFDINSIQSGPSSRESPRTTKPVTPSTLASNYESSATTAVTLNGRTIPLDGNSPLPTIDPASGRFSDRFSPADNVQLGFVGQQAQSIFAGSGSFSVQLTGLGLGDARNGIPVTYTYTAISSTGDQTTFTIPILPDLSGRVNTVERGPPFPAALANDELAARYGIPAGFRQSAEVSHGLVGYTATNAFGRGAVDGSITPAAGTTGVHYNGPRWFQGGNETKAHPNAGNVAGTENATDFNNAGELPGVLTIQNPQSYTQLSGDWRRPEAVLTGGVRAADFNFYWGAGGRVDSVVDLTHNVPVPFMAESLGGGWGFLNQSASTGAGSFDQRPEVLTVTDFGCVHPLREPSRAPDTQGPSGIPCTATPYSLSDVAVPGPIAIFGGVLANARTQATAAGPGFAVYVAGHIFMMELAPGGSVPPPGTIWTLRSYIGYVSGGDGAAGPEGPYVFTTAPRTFSALGAEIRLSYDVINEVRAASKDDLSRVHTVPDPYYVTSAFERATESKIIKFVNLPQDAIIRIYSSSGVLVRLLEHHSDTFGGAATWDVLSRNNHVVASGVYFYHIESGDARRVGRMTIVNFAE